MDSLIEKLRSWRGRRGLLDGVDLFRILSNKTLEDIANIKPTTKEELLKIKGFKDKKFAKYGEEILEIIHPVKSREAGISPEAKLFNRVNGKERGRSTGDLFSSSLLLRGDEPKQSAFSGHTEIATPSLAMTTEDKIFSVGDYLDLVNVALGDFKSKVRGEISSIDIRGNYLFFGLKDKDGGSMINCFMWQSNYRLCGVDAKGGMEIIVSGLPEVYKPSGRLTFRAETMELVGEGALKKQYDELKKKLEKEGLFAPEKKRPVPEFPEKIGLITSKTGAVIHDFLNNIGKFGYKITFLDSRVEGQLAVADLVAAVRYFKGKDIDALVIIRGGGSLESLQAFNNEALAREIAGFPKPVIAGIGHDKDVPLVSLAADIAVSTPTAVTKVLNASWEKATARLQIFERDIFNRFVLELVGKKDVILSAIGVIGEKFGLVFESFRSAEVELRRVLDKIGYAIAQKGKLLEDAARILRAVSPERQLKLGYSLAYSRGKLVRSANDVKISDEIDIKVADGNIKSVVKEITEKL